MIGIQPRANGLFVYKTYVTIEYGDPSENTTYYIPSYGSRFSKILLVVVLISGDCHKNIHTIYRPETVGTTH